MAKLSTLAIEHLLKFIEDSESSVCFKCIFELLFSKLLENSCTLSINSRKDCEGTWTIWFCICVAYQCIIATSSIKYNVICLLVRFQCCVLGGLQSCLFKTVSVGFCFRLFSTIHIKMVYGTATVTASCETNAFVNSLALSNKFQVECRGYANTREHCLSVQHSNQPIYCFLFPTAFYLLLFFNTKQFVLS